MQKYRSRGPKSIPARDSATEFPLQEIRETTKHLQKVAGKQMSLETLAKLISSKNFISPKKTTNKIQLWVICHREV